LLHVAIDEHNVAALLQRQGGFGLALELGEVALAQRWRGGQCLQSLDLAHQVILNETELRDSDAGSRVHAKQQEWRNDRASEHDLQLPQRPRLAECGHRSDP
jgi:hypothetical protein